MQIIPLKEKYRLSEEDINSLSAWIIEGRSLEEIYFHFSSKLTIKQIFLLADVIAKEMYDMPLKELAPEMIAQRNELNLETQEQWKKKKDRQSLMSYLAEISEDLSLYGIELSSEIQKYAEKA